MTKKRMFKAMADFVETYGDDVYDNGVLVGCCMSLSDRATLEFSHERGTLNLYIHDIKVSEFDETHEILLELQYFFEELQKEAF